jgi:HAD superfamily hydrolase (TIGR01509 family)
VRASTGRLGGEDISLIRAVIFDMDGLILDSETPEYLAWKSVYARYGLDFPLASWLQNVGRRDGPFDPLGPFREETSPIGPEAALTLWRSQRAGWEKTYLIPLPGVVPLLESLRERGLRTAVASSSGLCRVRELIGALGLAAHFDALACGDEVPHAKPAPDVYLLAARRVGAAPDACVALEDSESGVSAAKSAGMPCIAVPSLLTRSLDFSSADLVVDSLTEVTPEVLMALRQRPGS